MRSLANFSFFNFLAFTVLGQVSLSQTAVFNHLSVDDGLTTNNVWAIQQDYQGFIWLGTEDRLHRYDGYSFKIYSNNPEDSTSIGGNYILSVFEDSKRNLWIGTLNAGLALYNRETDSFYNFLSNENDSVAICGNTISSFLETKDQILWIASEQGAISYIDLKTFNPSTPIFHNTRLPESFIQRGALWVRSMLDEEGKLWLSVHGAGLVLFDPESQTFEEEFRDPTYKDIAIDLRADKMIRDDKGRIWLGTWGGGLFLFYPKEKKLLHYTAGSHQKALPNNQISSFAMDKSGNLWIGTDNGLVRMLDFNEYYPAGQFEVYQHDDFNDYSISNNAIKPIYMDKNNRLWVSSYYGGVNIYDPDYFRFSTVRNHPLKQGSLPHNNVTAITEDGLKNLWVATDGGGLAKLPEGASLVDSNKFEKVKLINSANGKEELKIKCLLVTRDKSLWIGTWGGGMFLHDPALNTTRHFQYLVDGRLPSESILALAEDQQGDIWIGTFSAGLARYDRTKDQFYYYSHSPSDTNSISGNKINTILVDSLNRIWAGVEGGGLNLYDRERDAFHRIHNDVIKPDANIISLFECTDHYLWIGIYTVGLARYKHETGEIQLIKSEDDLRGKLIQSIIEDKQNYLWISTNNGISKLIMKSREFISFSPEEGLQSKQFNANSAYVSDDGKVFFGGVKGMNIFDPLQIQKSEYNLDVVFTNFWINHDEFKLKSGEGFRSMNVVEVDHIDLLHYQNSFSIEFTALEYDFSHRTSYIIMLEGFDNEWQPRSTQHKVTYSNLNPGVYTLMVRPVNKDGFVSDRVSSFVIRIKPAWYQTRFFWVGLILMIVSLSVLSVQLRINFFKRQNRLLENKVSRRTEDLNVTNQELQVRNVELELKNDQILEQQEELETARTKLEELNANLENLVHERTDKLEKTIAELDRFVYSASHDLSAPLKSILGLLHIAKLDKDKNRTTEYLAYIQDSILKLEDVIRSLISYSRNNRLSQETEQVNLYDLILEIFDELQFLDGASRITHTVNIPPAISIMSDRKRLKIIFHNILSNAIKYADLDKPTSMIIVSLIDDGDNWIIEVHDNGIGIDEQFVDKVFGMFFRATEKSKGSGLGLFIVQETVSVLGGRVFIDSTYGKETTFSIFLPKQIP